MHFPVLRPPAFSLLLLLPLLPACGAERESEAAAGPADGEVNVYTHRHYDVDRELFREFEDSTGIRVNVRSASADELITRLETEGRDSPADLLITVDAGRLQRASERGLLQPVRSAVLERNVPSHLRHPEGEWYGLTRRARVLVVDPERVDTLRLRRYEDLADARWRGRILVRSSENVYNQSLLASLLAHGGEEEARRWAEAMVANMARRPQGGDTDQIRGVAAGEADVAVANTYYLGRLVNSESAAERDAARRLVPLFPNQDDRGAHVNVSGAGVTAHAPNRANAVRLLEFLTSEGPQRRFAEANYEYPVHEGVEWAPTLRSWGPFREDTLNLVRLGELNDEAVRTFDRAGWR